MSEPSPKGHLWVTCGSLFLLVIRQVTFSCYGIVTRVEGERSPESGFSHQILATNEAEKSEGDVRDADNPSHASNGLYIVG